MTLSRRRLFRSAYAAAIAYGALPMLGSARAYTMNAGAKLAPDPQGFLDLPEGFSYTLASATGGQMSDGLLRPGLPDGMACFAHPESADKCILTRNHEIWPDISDGSPFGENDELLRLIPEDRIYDRKPDGRPFFGGVTTVIYDLKNNRLEKDYLSLTGTTGNCAGGATPWGSWLSCEESAITAPDRAQKNHGFVFEVPSSAGGLVSPVPLKAMGRFAHEAAAVDLDTEIIYLTEDDREGLFYRFLPQERRDLAKGGRLQALSIRDWASADTRNWPRDWGSGGADSVTVGQSFVVDWVDLEDVEAPEGDLARRGFAAGAARFCRGEGMAYGKRPGEEGSIFFNCTQGGAARAGQVWKYTPSPKEGGKDEKKEPGMLTLIYESPSSDILDLCDNLAFSPWGDLILCEDGPGNQYLRGLTPDGRIYDFARNAHEDRAEFCGACFSPDGSVLFVNVQSPGFTFAIKGPWETLRA